MNTLTKFAAIALVAIAALLGVLAYRIAHAPPPAKPAIVSAPANLQLAATPSHPVIVAASSLAAGKTITAADLKVAMWPVAPPQAIVSDSDAIGKILKLDVSAGEPIMPNQLAQGLANYLSADERAVSIATDELVGVANSVTPGDFVDIFITLDKNGEVMGGQTRLMLSHIRVLAYGANTIDGPLVPSNATNVRGASPAAAPRTAILAVPLANVNELLLASKTGRLSFALRSPKDNAEPDTTLFASREPVLPGKPGLSSAQKALLAIPVNTAYAGESLAQFGGSPPPLQVKPLVRRKAARSGPGRSIQVIRGNQSETLRY